MGTYKMPRKKNPYSTRQMLLNCEKFIINVDNQEHANKQMRAITRTAAGLGVDVSFKTYIALSVKDCSEQVYILEIYTNKNENGDL